jgi:hypothetical protein
VATSAVSSQRLLVTAGTAAHHVAHPREEVAEHVGADDRVAADNPQIFGNPPAFDLLGGNDQHAWLLVAFVGVPVRGGPASRPGKPTSLVAVSESC